MTETQDLLAFQYNMFKFILHVSDILQRTFIELEIVEIKTVFFP